MSGHEAGDAGSAIPPQGAQVKAGHVDGSAQPPVSSHVSEQEESKSSEELKQDVDKRTEGVRRGFRFWSIIASLCVTGLLSALENTVVTTSLPTIVRDLGIGDNYIWITNVFFLTRYVETFCL